MLTGQPVQTKTSLREQSSKSEVKSINLATVLQGEHHPAHLTARIATTYFVSNNLLHYVATDIRRKEEEKTTRSLK